MLRISKCMSADGAERYYRDVLGRSGYYCAQVGVFHGIASDRLRVRGDASQEVFVALAQNRIPGTDERWTQRTNDKRQGLVWVKDKKTGELKQVLGDLDNRRAVWDIVNDVHKSVSIHVEATGDRKPVELFAQSNQEMMQFVERHIQRRVRGKGPDGRQIQEDKLTANAVWMTCFHTTSRPVDGKCDMQTHAHNCLFNGTYCEDSKKWYAIQPGLFHELAPIIQAYADYQYVRKLMEHGYKIRRTSYANGSMGWELAHINDEKIEMFSKRTQQLQREAVNQNRKIGARAAVLAKKMNIAIEDAIAMVRGELGGENRSGKNEASLTTDEQRADWRREYGAAEWDAMSIQTARAGESSGFLTDEQAKDGAVKHLFANRSVVKKNAVVAEVMNWGLGSISVEEAMEFVRTDPRFVHNPYKERRVTLREIVAEERRIQQTIESGRGKHNPIGEGKKWTVTDKDLDPGQLSIVHLTMKTRDMVIAATGKFGSGKTRAVKQAAAAVLEATGKEVFVLAPTGRSVDALQQGAGARDAWTLDRLRVDPKVQGLARGRVIFCDESTFLDNDNVQWLLDFVRDNGCRLVLWGDPRQMHAVQRGDPFRDCVRNNILDRSHLDKIYRQREAPELLAICEDYASEDPLRWKAGFEKMKAGIIREEESYEKALAGLVDAQMEQFRHKDTSLTIALLHRHNQDIADSLRTKMKEEGMLGKTDRMIEYLERVNVDDAQRSVSAYCKPGMIVEFHRAASGGWKSGDRGEILGEIGGRVMAKHGNVDKELPLDQSEAFGLFNLKTMPFADGEHLLITKNDRHSCTKTGQIVVAKDTKGNGILLPNGHTLDTSKPLHVRPGYSITAEASQGHEAKAALGFMVTDSLGHLNAEKMGVVVSRAKKNFRMITDCVEALEVAATTSGARESALAFVRSGPEIAKISGDREELRRPAIAVAAQEAFQEMQNQEIEMER